MVLWSPKGCPSLILSKNINYKIPFSNVHQTMIMLFLKVPSFLTLSLVLVVFVKIPSKDRLTVSMLCHNPASFLKSRTFTSVSPKTNVTILTFEIQNTQLCCKNWVLFIRRKMKKPIVVFSFNVYKKLGLRSGIILSSAFIGGNKD